LAKNINFKHETGRLRGRKGYIYTSLLLGPRGKKMARVCKIAKYAGRNKTLRPQLQWKGRLGGQNSLSKIVFAL
jgi:hypothetical protein